MLGYRSFMHCMATPYGIHYLVNRNLGPPFGVLPKPNPNRYDSRTVGLSPFEHDSFVNDVHLFATMTQGMMENVCLVIAGNVQNIQSILPIFFDI